MLLHRILAVNIFALAILAGSIFYLDGFRGRLTASAVANAETQVGVMADSLSLAEPGEKTALLHRLGQRSKTRLRLFGPDGAKRMDSWAGAAPTYQLRDPSKEPWRKDVARLLDNAFDAIVGAPSPPPLPMPEPERLDGWSEAAAARGGGPPRTMLRRAPEGTPFVSAAVRVPGSDDVLLITRNARDVRRIVRDERGTLLIIVIVTLAVSVLLSLFLARTIALPLRRLARAAHRVRLGRAREVSVPTLPERRDEIGLLARALGDMTQSLRSRIDATEAFAADVTHELKNPLASLRSAVDSLDRVDDPALRRQLIEVVRSDVVRLDRLIVDIAEASRLDAELSRARFEPVDLGALVESLLELWRPRAEERQVRLAFARPRVGSAVILGDEARLARAIDNIVDNAISFSPPGGLVEIGAAQVGGEVVISVEDEGKGVPAEARETIFRRFHSVRPEADGFGRHSGLGLAIAKATVGGHDGRIAVESRHDGRSGARFVLRFPEAPEP
ncbi:MAG TPA: HAMP domain-containing sensor histidine kinase [Allosphingosinicella sp.]|nr:HAMP domain-containing sensor histidine kinase [Allosphingosinicella sp.]